MTKLYSVDWPNYEDHGEASERMIKIILRDKETYEELPVMITRGRLAKHYNDFQVIGSRNGITIVEV